MSEETVNLILSLYPAGDPDWVQLIHEDDMWAAQVEAWSSFFHVDFECVWHHFGGERHYAGLDGVRAFHARLDDAMGHVPNRRGRGHRSRRARARARQRLRAP